MRQTRHRLPGSFEDRYKTIVMLDYGLADHEELTRVHSLSGSVIALRVKSKSSTSLD